MILFAVFRLDKCLLKPLFQLAYLHLPTQHAKGTPSMSPIHVLEKNYHSVLFFYKKRLLDVGRTLPRIKHYQTVKPYMPRNHFLGPRNSAATRCSAERCGNHATPGSKRLGWLCQGFKMNSMVQRCVYIYFNIYIYIHITVIIETHPYLVGG